MIPASNSLPSRQANSVMSGTHLWSDASAVKSPWTRSGAGAVLALPRRHLGRGWTPTRPHSVMIRATRLTNTSTPDAGVGYGLAVPHRWDGMPGESRRSRAPASRRRGRALTGAGAATGSKWSGEPRQGNRASPPDSGRRFQRRTVGSPVRLPSETRCSPFGRISRSILNSRFSLQSRSSSARSSTSSAPRRSASRACFTHAASEPSEIPSDLATSAPDRSDDRYNSTASLRNSSRYLLG